MCKCLNVFHSNLRGDFRVQAGLTPWTGSSLADVLRAQGCTATAGISTGNNCTNSSQLGQQQPSVYKVLVPHPTCFTGGLNLCHWDFENSVTAPSAVHFASQRNQGMYGIAGPRCVGCPFPDAATRLCSGPENPSCLRAKLWPASARVEVERVHGDVQGRT